MISRSVFDDVHILYDSAYSQPAALTPPRLYSLGCSYCIEHSATDRVLCVTAFFLIGQEAETTGQTLCDYDMFRWNSMGDEEIDSGEASEGENPIDEDTEEDFVETSASL